MGFEPMRIAPTDLETVSLTTRTSSLGRGCDLVLIALGHPRDNEDLGHPHKIRSAGIGPASTEWKSVILPLNYKRYVYQAPY